MLLLALLACKKDDAQETGLPEICNAGSAWESGETAFVEATEAWGLSEIGATGVRISAVDIDNDGWPDLAVRDGMAVGSTDAPKLWLLRNDQQGGFQDISESSGLRSLSQGGATWAFGDVDNDGDLDLYVGVDDSQVSGAVSQILLNDGSGVFSETSAGDLVLAGDRPYGAAFTDFDLDGRLDLFVGQYNAAQDRLYQGDGSGSFVDVTYDTGVKTERWSSVSVLNQGLAHSNAWSALACDLTGDGYPELLAASYGRAPNLLWENDGAGHYSNQSVASGYAFDDRQDWSDDESARCWCKLHPDDTDCEGVPDPRITCSTDSDAFRWDHDTSRELYRLGGNSGGTSCEDVDNDGRLDLLTSEIVHWDVGSSSDPSELLFNTGSVPVTFERPGREATGLEREHTISSWNEGDIQNSMLDFDNDGWMDLWVGSSDYPSTWGYLYHNLGGRQFEEVPQEQGIDHNRAHGSAVADFDRDGDLDIVVGHSTARCEGECYDTAQIRLFENQAQDSNFVQLKLVGTGGSNAAAIGARVEIQTAETTQTRVVDGGHGQWGQQDDLVVHAGLGPSCEATVRVHWPDAERSVEEFDLAGGYRFEITQGQGVRVVN